MKMSDLQKQFGCKEGEKWITIHETEVVVKREKIDFWRKELLNKTDEVLKSMREMLGIE